MLLLIFYHDFRALIADNKIGGMAQAWKATAERTDFYRAMAFMGYLIGVLVLTYIFGQMVALTLFCLLYLFRWGGYGWKFSTAYSTVVLVFIWGFYDQVMNLFFHRSIVFG